MEWQPIETAPEEKYIDVWISIPNSNNGGRRITDVCKTKAHSKGWVGLEGFYIEHLTHWMPLPNPPM